MAFFTNYATLSYNGGTAISNVVTGELVETLSATKTSVLDSYGAGESVTYVVSLINSGTAALTGLTVSDNLGGYAFGSGTIYPLAYVADSVRWYVNGVLQADPTVQAGPPLVISGINVPAGGNTLLIYEAAVTGYAPLGTDDTIINTATITGGGLTAPVTASETVVTRDRADLTISKAVNPSVVTENGQLTYTFIIENRGNTAAVNTDNVVLTDVFDPILSPITVNYNGATWAAGTNYTYDVASGTFASLPGQIVVPAATYTQNSDGTWTVNPGTATVTITGTV